MKELKSRSYNCKDEELPVICRYALSSLKRALDPIAEVRAYLPDNSLTCQTVIHYARSLQFAEFFVFNRILFN
ncbi:MAG: hypothetical protein LBQ01_02975 [Prevotellaceae bacterium]|jgi:hypothetical protein|nr:hypothetical protein [Prevotellaceae bacterium]